MRLDNPFATGNTAKIYISNNRVVKLFNDDLPQNEAIYEAKKQKYAYSCGIFVPKILDVTKIDGKQAIIMEYIKGKTLGNLLMANLERAEHYIKVSVEVQQKIHAHAANTRLEQMSDKLYRQINATSYLDGKQKTRLIQKLDAMTFEKRLCHGDFHPFNLILSNEDVAIIDWVDSSAGDVRADVYRTYLLFSQIATELADRYIHLYCEKSGFSRGEILQWAPIIAGARLSENVSSESVERLIKIVDESTLM